MTSHGPKAIRGRCSTLNKESRQFLYASVSSRSDTALNMPPRHTAEHQLAKQLPQPPTLHFPKIGFTLYIHTYNINGMQYIYFLFLTTRLRGEIISSTRPRWNFISRPSPLSLPPSHLVLLKTARRPLGDVHPRPRLDLRGAPCRETASGATSPLTSGGRKLLRDWVSREKEAREGVVSSPVEPRPSSCLMSEDSNDREQIPPSSPTSLPSSFSVSSMGLHKIIQNRELHHGFFGCCW